MGCTLTQLYMPFSLAIKTQHCFQDFMSQIKYDESLRCLISRKYHTLPGKRESEIEEHKIYNNNSIVKCLERISVIYYNQQKPPLTIKL